MLDFENNINVFELNCDFLILIFNESFFTQVATHKES